MTMTIGYQRAALIAAKLLIERHPNSTPNAAKLLDEAALPTGGFNVTLVLRKDQATKFTCRVCLDFPDTGASAAGHRRLRGEVDLFWPGLNLKPIEARTALVFYGEVTDTVMLIQTLLDDMVIVDREEQV